MPTATTMSTGGTSGGTGATGAPRGGDQPVALVPFVRASQEHTEPGNVDTSRQITTSDQDLGVFDVPSYGYMANLVILVTATGGAGTTVTTAEDGPWTALKNISLSEPNGATLLQFNSGYNLYLAHKYGGYVFGGDPRQSPAFSAPGASTGNFSFLLNLPVSLNIRDALGSLPNQNAAATFKLRLTLSAAATIYGGTVPTTMPTARVRAWLNAWDQPEQSSAGQMNSTTPPAMNTTQYWTEQQYTVNAGDNTIRLTRMGNYVRNFIFVFRRTAGTRANGDADWPTGTTVYWDTRPTDLLFDKTVWQNRIYERYFYTGAAEAAGARDNGVYPWDFCHEFTGKVGQENRDLWLPTLASTRFEIQGNFANAGTLTVLTNDVSVAGNVFM